MKAFIRAFCVAWMLIIFLSGCHRLSENEKKAIKTGAGGAGTLIGLPPIVGEGIAGLILAAISAFAGHKHGRKKERACKVAA